MVKFILASQSPARADLLRQIGLDFEVMPSNADETSVPIASNPSAYVKRLAKLKAQTIAKQTKGRAIIAADTVVLIDGNIIGKPKDKDDALKTLRALSGRVHKVITGICVVDPSGKMAVRSAVTKVKFKELDPKLLGWYMETGEPFNHAGSYVIQGKGAVLVDWIKGDYSNVVGLPLALLLGAIEELNLL
jgi:septum formation protein